MNFHANNHWNKMHLLEKYKVLVDNFHHSPVTRIYQFWMTLTTHTFSTPPNMNYSYPQYITGFKQTHFPSNKKAGMIFETSSPSIFFRNQLHLSTSLKGFERHECRNDGRISTDLISTNRARGWKCNEFAWDFQTLGLFFVCRGLPSYVGNI